MFLFNIHTTFHSDKMGLKAIWNIAWGWIAWAFSFVVKIVLYLLLSLFGLIFFLGLIGAILVFVLYALGFLSRPTNDD